MRNMTLALVLVAVGMGMSASAGEMAVVGSDCHDGRCGLAGAAVRVLKAPVVLVDRLIDRPCERHEATECVNACSCVDSCQCQTTVIEQTAVIEQKATDCGSASVSHCHRHRRGLIVRRRCR